MMNHFRTAALVLSLLTIWLFSACGHKQSNAAERRQSMINSANPMRPLFLVKKEGRWGYIDREGKIAITPQFDEAQDFSEGLAAVGLGYGERSKWGYINTAGKMVIEPAFEDAYQFSDGLALVCLNGMYGFIDATGQIAIKPQFAYSRPFSDGFALITMPAMRLGPITFKEEKRFFIDKKGDKLVAPDFGAAAGFSEGLASVSINGKRGYINTTGEFVISAEPGGLPGDFSEGLALLLVQNNKRVHWGYIDKTGQIVIKPQYPKARPFREGVAAVKVNGKFSYIDKSGKEIIKTAFETVGDFSDGMAKVRDSAGNYGYIDKRGRIAIAPQFYNLAGDFRSGLAKVTVVVRSSPSNYDPKYGYIDKTGKFIWGPTN
jgi:hypothetical protein